MLSEKYKYCHVTNNNGFWIGFIGTYITITTNYERSQPVTVAERSKACTVFARSETGIVSSNSTEDMDVWCVYAFILCLCCPVFR
jgi:hypothetical protein